MTGADLREALTLTRNCLIVGQPIPKPLHPRVLDALEWAVAQADVVARLQQEDHVGAACPLDYTGMEVAA